MVRKFALLDSNFNVIGTINLPDYLTFDRPHHTPHAEIKENHIDIKLGMAYDGDKDEFYVPNNPVKGVTSPAPNEPPLPDGKRSLFTWRRK